MMAAAVCFRRRGAGLQVRLVRTADGERWTFPRSLQKPDEAITETVAVAAAKQAGVVGVVADNQFTEFRYGRRTDDLAAAFLLAVQSVAPSGEPGRKPTWFDLLAAHQHLAEGRDPAHAQELQRVLQMVKSELQDT